MKTTGYACGLKGLPVVRKKRLIFVIVELVW